MIRLGSIRSKLILVLLTITLLTAAGLILLALHTYREDSLRNREVRLSAWGQIIGDLRPENLTAQDRGQLETLSRRAQARILYLDGEGRVQADSAFLELKGRKFEHQEVITALKTGKTAWGVHFLPGEGWVMYVTTPVLQEKEVKGLVFLSHDINDLFLEIQHFGWRLALLALGVLAVVAGMGFFLARQVTSPLVEMTGAVRLMGKGYLRQRLQVRGNDEVAQLARAFNEMSQELEKGDEELRAFVANASHEIRSPISSLKVLTEALLARPGQDKAFYDEYLEDMNREIDRLSQLVQELLVLARLEKRPLEWQVEEAALSDILQRVVSRFTPGAREKGIRFSSEIAGGIFIYGQATLLERMAGNLVDNALKYTEENGEVSVALRLGERDIILEVADTGIGIPDHLQPYVWQRFFRVDTARSRELGGSGLGLSLVKQIAELHQAKLNLKSEVGKGTIVTVAFPRTKLCQGNDNITNYGN